MAKGKFIVLDGIDGSGKATQTKLLADRLNAVHWSFPQYGSNMFADLVEDYLHGKHGKPDPYYASFPYAMDRLMARDKMVWEMEQHGRHIVCDRWVSANKIHQCARLHQEAIDSKGVVDNQKFFDFIDKMEYDTLRLPVPDVSILLDIDSKQAVVNTQKRNKAVGKVPVDFHEELTHLELARAAAFDVVAYDMAKGREWILIECCGPEGMLSVEEIHTEIYRRLFCV